MTFVSNEAATARNSVDDRRMMVDNDARRRMVAF